MKLLKDLEKRQKELEAKVIKNTDDISSNKAEFKEKHERLDKYIQENVPSLLERMEAAENEIEALKKRPVGGGEVNIDYDNLCMKDEFLDLAERVRKVEIRNLE